MKKLLALALGTLVFALAGLPVGAAEGDKPRIDLYVEAMSQNSWQVILIFNAIETRMPGRFAFSVTPLVFKDKAGTLNAGTTGPDGLDEAGRMLTVKKLYPDRVWNYLVGRSMSPWPEGWTDAAQFAGIDPLKLEAEVKKTAQTELAAANTVQERIGLKFPIMFINDQPYQGDFGLLPLMTAFNDMLPKNKRYSIPKIEFSEKDRAYIYEVVADEGEFGKSDPQLNNGLKRLLKAHKPELTQLSYSKAKGMKEFAGVDINFLPFYTVKYNAAVAKTLAYPIKNGLLVKQGDMLAVVDTGRAGVFIKKPKTDKKLELFVMTQCPFGVMAVNNILDNKKAKTMPEDVPVELHYIVTVSSGPKGLTFDSLHGTAEWEEAVRQLVIQEKYPAKLWDYLSERNKDYKSGMWEAAAEKAGLVPADIKAQFEYGKTLLQKDAAYSASMGMSASPSILWEGRIVVQGMDSLKKIPGFEKLKISNRSDGTCAN